MIKSMTAFARESDTAEVGDLTWEVRSVNHRFLEANVRLPEDLRALEPAVRERLGARLGRGKLDCSLRFAPRAGEAGALSINHRLLEQLLQAADEIATRIGEPATPHVIDLMQWPGLLQEPERDLDAVGAAARALLERTLDTLVETRAREGERLRALILERCERLLQRVDEVRARMPEVLAGVRSRIADRLAEVREELDPGRLEQEMALLAQRLDVDEEMDRLSVHVAEVRKALDAQGPVGRRLDFLMQELNREANTLSSKSSDSAVTLAAVDMKVLIEQMREQVQNIE
ncbi:YicC family protein [Thiohalocapsa marina]|uniref:YicC family protein n=1 Tax=Thiohalocapsa marina TaxID=424902 RepID=A0A5M8FK54_9GAMM|nr:YicC/YloC family endoribonuclease [Thiohalocapsa marina]KAA6185303.1 YicC family protein [Thiohalocapsa marina]